MKSEREKNRSRNHIHIKTLGENNKYGNGKKINVKYGYFEDAFLIH